MIKKVLLGILLSFLVFLPFFLFHTPTQNMTLDWIFNATEPVGVPFDVSKKGSISQMYITSKYRSADRVFLLRFSSGFSVEEHKKLVNLHETISVKFKLFKFVNGRYVLVDEKNVTFDKISSSYNQIYFKTLKKGRYKAVLENLQDFPEFKDKEVLFVFDSPSI
jgi:hypothetical protein